MNAIDWVIVGMTIGFVLCGIVACIIYEQAKREARAKREGREYKAETAPTVEDLYIDIITVQNFMLEKQDEMYDKRQNMTCEELGSKNGVQFAKEYEQFCVAVDLMGDVREYMRQAVETQKQ